MQLRTARSGGIAAALLVSLVLGAGGSLLGACGPFADYQPSADNCFMTLTLHGGPRVTARPP